MRAVIVPTYRARDLQLPPGASDDRLPSRAPIVKSWAVVSGWYKKF
jgi:hypothetical protein